MSGRGASFSPAVGVRRSDPNYPLNSPASAGTRYAQLAAAEPQNQDWTQKRRSEGRGESTGSIMSPATPAGAAGSKFEGFLTGFSSSASLAAPPWFIHHTQTGTAAPSSERDRRGPDPLTQGQYSYLSARGEERGAGQTSQPPQIRGAAAPPLTSPKAPVAGRGFEMNQNHQQRIQQQRFADVYDVTSSTNTNELAASPQPFDEKANPRSPWLAGPHQHLHRPDEPLPSSPAAARPHSAAAAMSRQEPARHVGSPWLAGPHAHLHQDGEPLPRPPGGNPRSASLEERRERYATGEVEPYRPTGNGDTNPDRYRQQQQQQRDELRYPSESSGRGGLRTIATEDEIRSLRMQLQDVEGALASAKAEAKMLSTQLQQERSLKDTAVNSARYSSLEEAMRIVQSEGIRGLERRLANERLRSFGSGDLGQPVNASLYSSTPGNGAAGAGRGAGGGSGYPAGSSSQTVPVFMDGPSLQRNKRLQEEYQRRMRESFDLHTS